MHLWSSLLCASPHHSAPLCTALHHCSPPPLCTAPALLTEWGANVTAENAWREYPRPQLVRGDGVSSWRCLNGLWEYAISAANAPPPSAFEGSILVSLLDDLTLTLTLTLTLNLALTLTLTLTLPLPLTLTPNP